MKVSVSTGNMKFLAVTLLALAAAVSARNVKLEENTAFGYITKVAIPLAEKIRKAEEEGDQNPSRIVGGSASSLGQFPYQVIILLYRFGYYFVTYVIRIEFVLKKRILHL